METRSKTPHRALPSDPTTLLGEWRVPLRGRVAEGLSTRVYSLDTRVYSLDTRVYSLQSVGRHHMMQGKAPHRLLALQEALGGDLADVAVGHIAVAGAGHWCCHGRCRRWRRTGGGCLLVCAWTPSYTDN